MGTDPSSIVMSVPMGSCVYLGGDYVRSTMVGSGEELISIGASIGGNIFPMIWIAGDILGQFRFEPTPLGCVASSQNDTAGYLEYSCNRGRS